jgi:hypothetical protein
MAFQTRPETDSTDAQVKGATRVSAWKDFFDRWPEAMAKRGLIITQQGEQVPFVGFMTAEHFLLVQRHAPDTVGARTFICPYDELAGLKLTDVVRTQQLQELGFEGKLPKH